MKLLHRPIGVLMSFLALIIFSVIALFNLPVSLLPEMNSPQIVVQLEKQGFSAADWEESITDDLRILLRPTNNLEKWDVKSENNYSTIKLTFRQGTPMNMAFLDISEKVDRFYSLNPLLDERPRVIRKNASEIPMLKLQIIPKADLEIEKLTILSKNIIKRRLERLDGVSVIDVSGTQKHAVFLYPDKEKLLQHHLSNSDLARAILRSNQSLNSVKVNSGNYQYNLSLDLSLKSKGDLYHVPVEIGNNKQLPLGYFVKIKEKSPSPDGYHLFNGKRGIVFNIHKQPGAQLTHLKDRLKHEISLLSTEYPDLDFNITRDQSVWLTSSINNLTNSLLYGGFFAVLILFFFIGSFRLSIIMLLNLPVTVLVSFLLFYLFNISINLISLAGIALGIGMLIDNTIIVIDNIERKRIKIKTISKAAFEGTNEVFSALLSSVLTTLAVFLPLLFLGGTASELLYDQAISIAIILIISLVVSYILTPVLYVVLNKNNKSNSLLNNAVHSVYKKHFNLLWNSKITRVICFSLFPIVGLWSWYQMSVQGMPDIQHNDWHLNISWNEYISVEENRGRSQELIDLIKPFSENIEADIGKSDFYFTSTENGQGKLDLYFEPNSEQPTSWRSNLLYNINSKFPHARATLNPAPNIFDHVFDNSHSFFEVRFRKLDNASLLPETFIEKLKNGVPKINIIKHSGFNTIKAFNLVIHEAKLQQFGISKASILDHTEKLWGNSQISFIVDPGNKTPIYFSENPSDYTSLLNKEIILTKNGQFISLSEFITIEPYMDPEYILSDENDIYQAVSLSEPLSTSDQQQLNTWALNNDLKTSYHGDYFDGIKQFNQLIKIFGISLLLLYFILSAQFESFIQPLIILILVPLGLCGSLLLLYLVGSSLNIMSGIGMIVVSGIMVNDTILKIDTYNRFLRKRKKKDLHQIIIEVGELRLKPIIMTSLTTIFAIAPVLLSSGLGADLQYSMVLAIIGGLSVGTYLSIFLLPFLYLRLKRSL